MFMPSIFSDSFLDGFFDIDRPMRLLNSDGRRENAPRFNSIMTNVMKTDIKENDGSYELAIDLPGYSKDDVQAELKDGYMTITASKNDSNEDKEDLGCYIRRERYYGSCSRSFYVGEQITEDDIKASFKDGILYVTVPKKEAVPEIEEKKLIQIEG